jgi:hypothetical protein
VLADGGGLRLVPYDPVEMEDMFRILGHMQFGSDDSSDVDPQERLRLMAIWEAATRMFRRRLTDVLGGLRDGPWEGHSHKCALFVWIVAFLVLHRAITHTMLVAKDPATLTDHLDRLWRSAHASNVFTTDPSAISPRELLAALQLAGLSCEMCHTAGAMAQLCWKCKRNTLGGARPKDAESAYRRARDNWQKADASRGALSTKDLADKFRASPEGKAANAASSAAPAAHTAEECMVVLAKHLNKVPRPLLGPVIKYK